MERKIIFTDDQETCGCIAAISFLSSVHYLDSRNVRSLRAGERGGGAENRTNMFCRSALLWLRAATCRGTPSHFPSNLFHLLCLTNSRRKFLNNRSTIHLRLRVILTHFVIHLSLFTYTWISDIRCLRSGGTEVGILLIYQVAQIRTIAPTFRSNLLLPTSGQSERSEPLTNNYYYNRHI